MQKLGGTVINLSDMGATAVAKGETLQGVFSLSLSLSLSFSLSLSLSLCSMRCLAHVVCDTDFMRVMERYSDIVVLRHPEKGAVQNVRFLPCCGGMHQCSESRKRERERERESV
jgi:hypothetical protein